MVENGPMDIQAAIEHLSDTHPAEAKHLYSVSCRDVVALGTDESYALRDSKGEIRCYKEMLSLTHANDGLVKVVGKFTISAQGYVSYMKAIGGSVMFPPTVMVEGRKVGNPYVHRDERHKIISVTARAIAYMFSNKGVPLASDWTTILDIPTYRMIDFLAKSKEHPQAFQYLPNDTIPIDLEGQTPGTWAEYPADEATKLCLNTSHPEAIKWLISILNREKKAVDYCQTFARRNASKHLVGLQKPPNNASEWHMVVYAWRPIHGQMFGWNNTKYLELQKNIDTFIQGGEIDVISGTERVEEDDVQMGMEDTIDPEDKPETDEPDEITEEDREEAIDIEIQETEPEPETEELDAVVEYSDADKKVVETYEKAIDYFEPQFKEVCSAMKLNPSGPHTVEQMEAINKAIDSMV